MELATANCNLESEKTMKHGKCCYCLQTMFSAVCLIFPIFPDESLLDIGKLASSTNVAIHCTTKT